MGSIDFDDSRFPLVVITFRGVATDQEFSEYLGKMSELLARRRKNVTIFDARHAGATPAVQRRRQADWIAENRAALQQFSCGSAFVIGSAIVRGALTAILWVQPMPVPHIVLATLEEAERWAARQLEKEGVPPPSGRGRGGR